MGGDGRLQRGQRRHDDRVARCCATCSRTSGASTASSMSDWYAARVDRGGRQRRARPRDARARRARGATRSSPAVRDGARERGGGRRQGPAPAACSPRGSARWTASTRAEPPAQPWSDERGRRRAARDRRGRLRAGAQRGRAAAARRRGRCGASRSSVRTPRVARTLGGGSATVFPPYTVSPLDGLRAALGPPSSWTTRAACARTPGFPPPPPSSSASVEVRFLAADGSLLGSERRRTGALHLAGLLRRGRGGERGRGRRGPRDACAPRRRASTSSAPPGSGASSSRSTASRSFDVQLELPPGADPAEAHMRPPQHGVPVVLDDGPGGRRSSCATSPAGRRGHLVRDRRLGLPAQRRAAVRARRGGARARRGRSPRAPTSRSSSSAPPRRSRARASTATSLALPGRQDELVRRVADANPRTVVVVNAGAPVLLPWADDVPAVLLTWFPGQEFGPRARRRAARRRRARRAPADHLARVDRRACRPPAGRRDARLRRGHLRRLPRLRARRAHAAVSRSATASATPAGSTWSSRATPRACR